jgi:hypothetical protein
MRTTAIVSKINDQLRGLLRGDLGKTLFNKGSEFRISVFLE